MTHAPALESMFPSRPGLSAQNPVTCLPSLPGFAWTREGSGDGRVYRTEVSGRRVVLSRGVHLSRDMWILDVEGEPRCCYDERLSVAMDRQSVALALDEHLRRTEAQASR